MNIPAKAKYIAKEYYPKPNQKEVFAVRYFDNNHGELAYYIPGMLPHCKIHLFDVPRLWHPSLLATLSLVDL